MMRAQPVEIPGDGLQTRDLFFVADMADMADAIVAAVDARQGVLASIGSGEAGAIRRLHGSIAGLVGRADAPVHVAPRSGGIRHGVIDSRRARQTLGWTARTVLLDGLAQTLEGHRGAVPSTITEV